MRSRPPGLIESIVSAKHYERDPRLDCTTGPDHRLLAPRAGTSMCRSETRVAARFLVGPPLLRFSSPATLTGCARALSGAAGLRTIPLRRFIRLIASARAPSRQATCRRRMILLRPCGFPLERIRCDEARLADAFRSVRSVPIESVARAARVSPMGPVPRPCRRVDDLLL